MQKQVLPLENRVELNVVIKEYHRPLASRPDHLWDFVEYGPRTSFHGRRYRQLHSDKELNLHAGEHAIVRGGVEELIYSVPFLRIDEVVGEKEFMVKPGDTIQVSNPNSTTRKPNATYFDWIHLQLNGRDCDLLVPTLATGQTLPMGSYEYVRVTTIVKPEERRGMGYLVLAKF